MSREIESVDHDSLTDFLEFGVVAPDHFFLTPALEPRPLPVDLPFPEDTPPTSPNRLLNSFIESLERIVVSDSTDSFAMSGGADTRLIASVLLMNFPEYLRSKRVYCRIHPELGPERDRDFLLARSFCEKFGINLELEISRNSSASYLLPLDQKPSLTLSGLWGGETLGGAMLEHACFQPDQLLNTTRPSPLKNHVRLMISRSDFRNKHLALHTHILLNSRSTAFYKSLSWFDPGIFAGFASTPFLDRGFLQELFTLEDDLLKGYGMYEKIVDLLNSKHFEIPVNNPCLPKRYKKNLTGIGVDAKEKNQTLVPGPYDSVWHEKIREKVNSLKGAPYSNYLLKLLPYLNLESRDVLETGLD